MENAARKCRVKKSIEKAQQEEAFKEFVAIIGANGGKIPYGAVEKLVKAYHRNGFKGVTRQNLYYRLERSKKCNKKDDSTMVGTTVTTTSSSLGTVSSVTMSYATTNRAAESSGDSGTSTTNTNGRDTSSAAEIVTNSSVNKGGRKKGSTKAAHKHQIALKQQVTTTCAILYKQEIDKATKLGKVVNSGTLKKIINDEEEKMGLSLNSISADTIRSRIKRGNLGAENKNQISPLHDVEPLILEFCIRLAKMGRPLTKTTVLELANDLIAGTE
jgi:hypothetical protein